MVMFTYVFAKLTPLRLPWEGACRFHYQSSRCVVQDAHQVPMVAATFSEKKHRIKNEVGVCHVGPTSKRSQIEPRESLNSQGERRSVGPARCLPLEERSRGSQKVLHFSGALGRAQFQWPRDLGGVALCRGAVEDHGHRPQRPLLREGVREGQTSDYDVSLGRRV